LAGEDRGDDRAGRGGGEEPEERTDLWMATYADMVTLLMTFFVLMFAISNVDASKASLLFAALSRDGLTAEQFMELQPDFLPEDDYERFPSISSPSPSPPDSTDPGSYFGNEELEALASLIDEYIFENGLGDRISLTFDGDFLLLTLANDIWFVSGSADITPRMREIAAELAQLLASTFSATNPFEIVVEGHTDNRPINTTRYPSNWHVSKDRATNFLEILYLESGIDPAYFSAKACGEFRPIASNDTPEGRQMNRRVEIKISLERQDVRWRSLNVEQPAH